MKCGIVFVFLVGLSLVYGSRRLANEIRLKCQGETEFSDEGIEHTRAGILNEADQNQACFVKCVLSHLSFMDENGDITPEEGMKKASPKIIGLIKPAINACSSTDGTDPCQKAIKMFQCIHELFPAIYKLF